MKTLAKLCNHWAKHYAGRKGVLDRESLTPERQEKTLAVSPLREIWGVGSAFEAALTQMGAKNELDFNHMDSVLIQKRFGVVGARTLWELRGQCDGYDGCLLEISRKFPQPCRNPPNMTPIALPKEIIAGPRRSMRCLSLFT